nr:hypothetical protein [Tanacetum cinerariifolium]
MALAYQNPFYLKQAQKKQQSLYDGKVLLAKHDPIVVHDSDETLQLAQESREKMKQMNKEIKPNVRNQVAQNPRVQNDGIQNQNGNGNLVAVRAEGNAAGHNGNQIRCYNCRGLGHFARDCTVRPRRRDAAYLQTQLLIAQKEEARIQIQAEEYDLMAAAADLDEIEEVNAN